MPARWTESLRLVTAAELASPGAAAPAGDVPGWASAILREMEFLLTGRSLDGAERHFVGARIRGRSVTGCGATLLDALLRAAGEGAEQIMLAALEAVGPGRDDSPGFELGSRSPVSDGGARLRKSLARAPASEGCGAWTDPDAAAAIAILELVERDAAMLWWAGGRPGRLISRAGPERGGEAGRADGRETILIDISEPPLPPVVAALSFDETGRGFASGVAAGADMRAAISGAVRELAMIEMGRDVIRWKREILGEGGLNDTDMIEERRSALIDRDAVLSLGVETGAPAMTTGASAPRSLERVAAALSAGGVDCAVFDLGAVHGLHVAKAVSEALQPSRAGDVTTRLARAQADHGGPRAFTCGMPLY